MYRVIFINNHKFCTCPETSECAGVDTRLIGFTTHLSSVTFDRIRFNFIQFDWITFGFVPFHWLPVSYLTTFSPIFNFARFQFNYRSTFADKNYLLEIESASSYCSYQEWNIISLRNERRKFGGKFTITATIARACHRLDLILRSAFTELHDRVEE